MNNFETTITTIYGQQGKIWLAHLPLLVAQIATQWNLSELKPLENLSHHYVLGGLQGSNPIVLKMGLNCKSLQKEGEALQAFGPENCVRFLQYTTLGGDTGVLLLERAVPGNNLSAYVPENDTVALDIACKLMQRLHHVRLTESIHTTFTTLADRLTVLDKEWNIPHQYLQRARILKQELLSSTHRTVLLHGDFHHENILLCDTVWKAIDPQAVVGDALYDMAIFICNPLSKIPELPDVQAVLEKRIPVAAHLLTADAVRLKKWCFVHALVAWAWSLEDKQDHKVFEHLARMFF